MINASFGYLDPDHKEEFRAEVKFETLDGEYIDGDDGICCVCSVSLYKGTVEWYT